ncbi:MAG: iron ABC transporter permease [Rikenellaceae bacterium]
MSSKTITLLMVPLAMLLFMIDVAYGSVDIGLANVWKVLVGSGDELHTTLVMNFRLPKAIVAVIAGASLSCCGLEMQTLFRNPLAGPYVLGVSSGASLGVALFLLGAPLVGLGFNVEWIRSIGFAGAAWIGSAAILLVITALASRLKDIMTILIMGMMIGSGISAGVEILQFMSPDSAVKSFVVWTMGNLGSVSYSQIAIMAAATSVGLIISFMMIKPLNLLLMGESYARTMGLNVKRTRILIFTSTVLLAGTVTAFCGPIGFVGIVAPHITRMIFKDSDHRKLMPATVLCGIIMVLVCDIISQLPGSQTTLPINTVTSLLGIPMVLVIVMRGRTISRM